MTYSVLTKLGHMHSYQILAGADAPSSG